MKEVSDRRFWPVIFVLMETLCGNGNGERCQLQLKNPNFSDGIYDPLATNVFLKKTNVFLTEVIIALNGNSSNCSVGISHENGEMVEAFFAKDQTKMDEWFLKPTSETYHYLMRKSKENFAPAGKYTIAFSADNLVEFFNLHQSSEEKNVTTVFEGAEDVLAIKTNPIFRACLELHRGEEDASKSLNCGSPVKLNGRNALLPTCTIIGLSKGDSQSKETAHSSFKNKNNGSIANEDFLLVEVHNGTAGAEEWENYNFLVRCHAKTVHHKRHNVDLRFKVMANNDNKVKESGVAAVGRVGEAKGVFTGLAALLFLLTAAAVISLAHKRWLAPRKYFHLLRHPHGGMDGGATADLARLKRMPVSAERQHTVLEVVDESSEDEEGEKLEDIWPSWIIKAKLMRFPRSDISFDANKPLGCGNYGFVYNGSVLYGTAR